MNLFSRYKLLQDNTKIMNFIKLVRDTPISYQSMKKTLPYDELIRSTMNYDDFNHDILPQLMTLIKRDLPSMNEKEYLSLVQGFSNYVELCEQQPQLDKNLILFLNQTIQYGTFIQKFALQFHLSLFYNDNILLYSQEAMQLKKQVSEYVPNTIEEQVLKLYWDRLLIRDEQMIQYITSKQKNLELIDVQIDKLTLIEFVKYLEYLFDNVNNISLTTMMVSMDIIKKSINDSLIESDISEDKIQILTRLFTKLGEKIVENLDDLSAFYLCQFFATYRMFRTFNAMIFDLLINHLHYRDYSQFSISDCLDLIKIMSQNQDDKPISIDNLIKKLYDQLHRIKDNQIAEVLEVVNDSQSLLIEKFLKSLEKRIQNSNSISSKDLVTIFQIYLEADLLTEQLLRKQFPKIEKEIHDLPLLTFGQFVRLNVFLNKESPQILQIIQTIQFDQPENEDIILDCLVYLMKFNSQNQLIPKLVDIYVEASIKNEDSEYMEFLVNALSTIEGKTQINLSANSKKKISEYLQQNKHELSGQIKETFRIK
ncbi:hypothetical protein pb186bvf_015587 [Paramecium bursaria]